MLFRSEAAFADVEGDLTGDDNIFGARALADRLAAAYPDSPAASRVQGLAALRADDPAAAVQALTHALADSPAKDSSADTPAEFSSELGLTTREGEVLSWLSKG